MLFSTSTSGITRVSGGVMHEMAVEFSTLQSVTYGEWKESKSAVIYECFEHRLLGLVMCR